MNLRRVFLHIETTFYEHRLKDWEPRNCIDCPRKGQIANDRCLELQADDHCLCPNAATRSIRAELAADEEQEHGRRRRSRRAAAC